MHLTLAAAFGAAFAVLAPLARGRGMLVAFAAGFGLVLYVVKFQILGRLFFEWFQEGPNQAFEVVAHLGYGLLLAPFTLDFAAVRSARAVGRAHPAEAARA